MYMMYDGVMVRTQISLTPEQYEAVQRLAERREESMAAVIRDAVDRLVALSQQTAAEALLEMAGQFPDITGDGATNVAEDHDEFLYGPVAE